MFRRTLATAFIALSLVGCSANNPIDEALDDIRENAPSLAHNSDETLFDLMIDACEVLDESNGDLTVFALIAMQNDLDGHDVGVVAANAIQAVCPEHDPNK